MGWQKRDCYNPSAQADHPFWMARFVPIVAFHSPNHPILDDKYMVTWLLSKSEHQACFKNRVAWSQPSRLCLVAPPLPLVHLPLPPRPVYALASTVIMTNWDLGATYDQSYFLQSLTKVYATVLGDVTRAWLLLLPLQLPIKNEGWVPHLSSFSCKF